MKTTTWLRVFRLCRLGTKDPFETYETTQPWVTYAYLWKDRALDWFGFSFVRVTCCICATQEDIRIREGDPQDASGKHFGRAEFLTEHVHRGVNKNPLAWVLPLRNPAALRSGDLEEVLDLAASRARRDAAQ